MQPIADTFWDNPEPEMLPAPKEFIPTAEQQDILDFIANDHRNGAFNAVAGASKTSICVKGAAVVRKGRVAFSSFSNTIVDELKSRLPSGCEALTLHSLGRRILLESYPGIDLDERLCRKMFAERFPEYHREGRGKWAGHFFPHNDFECVERMVEVCKTQLLDPVDQPNEVVAACDALGVELPDAGSVRECLTVSAELLDAVLEVYDRCDFADMIWRPVRMGLVEHRFDTFFLDESQDLGPCQHELAARVGARTVMVADPNQAIFQFAGAADNGYDILRERLNASELPLTISFRCPTQHADLARIIVPRFRHRDGAPEGTVGTVQAQEARKMLLPGDAVICRTNAPVVSLIYKLLAAGTPAMVRGRAIGDGLAATIRKLRADTPEDLSRKAREWYERTANKLVQRQAPKSALRQLRDKYECLCVLNDGCDTIAELLALIGSAFADDNPVGKVVGSSIHRFKGCERDRVFILEPGLMPMGVGPGERNLAYVAATRSRSELYFVPDMKHFVGAEEWMRQVV